jgi:hypothetical protein
MTFSYTPKHRRDALFNKDLGVVSIGITGKRNQQKLIFKRKSGEYASIHVSYLTYEIDPEGSLTVVFSPFAGYVRTDESCDYIQIVAMNLEKCIGKVEKVFSINGISYTLPHNIAFSNLVDAILYSPEEDEELSRHTLKFFSPTYYFPISRYTGLWELKRAFVALQHFSQRHGTIFAEIK